MIGRVYASRPILPPLYGARTDMTTIIKAPPRRKPDDVAPAANRPENAATGKRLPYGLLDCAIFLAIAMPLLFAMCATGRAGA